MKKMIFLLLLACSVASTYPVAYTVLRSNFKEDMYEKQKGLMKHKEYMKFIEECMLEAEQLLAIPAAALQRADAQAMQTYLTVLLKLNRLIFIQHVAPNNKTNELLEEKKVELLNAIKVLKAKWNLEKLDVQTEHQATIEFFSKAAKAFHKKLGFIARAKAAALKLVYR